MLASTLHQHNSVLLMDGDSILSMQKDLLLQAWPGSKRDASNSVFFHSNAGGSCSNCHLPEVKRGCAYWKKERRVKIPSKRLMRELVSSVEKRRKEDPRPVLRGRTSVDWLGSCRSRRLAAA